MGEEKIIPIAIAGALSLITFAGCSSAGNDNSSDIAQVADISTTDMFTDRDFNTEYDANSPKITLTGSSAEVSGDGVTVNGSTITITAEGTYIVSGTLDDGQIIIDTDDSAKVHLVFRGANINSSTSAALYIKNCDKAFLTLDTDSANTISNGGTFTAIDDNNVDGAIFSKDDLTINGAGSLTVTSPAGNGIVCKDDLVFTGGNITITSSEHGLDANDSVRSINATFNITSGKDGIHSDNSDDTSLGFVYVENGTFNITSEGDGISASAYVLIQDGTFNITTGGGSENGEQKSSESWGQFNGPSGGGTPSGGMNGGHDSGSNGGPGGSNSTMSGTSDSASADIETFANVSSDNQSTQTADSNSGDASTSIKGIKATDSIIINGGTYNIDSADDSLHSNNSIKIAGGTFNIESGDDGVHADNTLNITGGNINVNESYEGLEAQNVTIENGNITITATDDGINAAGGTDSSASTGGRDGMFGGGYTSSSTGSIVISGGNILINASGDGIDANGSLEITGGNTTVYGPTQGDTSVLDYDTTGTITGGTFIGTGAATMAQTLTGANQGILTFNANGSSGSQVEVKDSNGKTVAVFTPSLSYQYLVVTNDEIVSGQTYTVSIGENSMTVTAE